MATDYSLNLKATLDTSQVKQQLLQLQVQMNLLKGNLTGGGPKSLNINGLNMSNSILTALKSLQSSIDRLNANISKLASQGVARQTSIQTGSNRGGSYIPGSGFGTPELRSALDKYQDNALKLFFKENKGLSRRAFERITPSERLKALLLNRFGEDYLKEANIFRRTPAGQDWINEVKNKDQKLNNRFLRGARFLMGAQAFGKVGNSLQENGYYKTGSAVNAISEGVMSGAMGAMALGGPAGIALGVGTAATSYTDSLVKAAQAAGKALMEFCKSVDSSKAAMNKFIKNTNFEDWSRSLKKMSYADLRQTVGSKEKALEKAREERTAYADQVVEDRSEALKKYLKRLNLSLYSGENRFIIESDYAADLLKITNKFNLLELNVTYALREFDAASNALADYRKVLEESAAKIKAALSFDKQLNSFFEDIDIKKAIKSEDKKALLVSKSSLQLQLNTAYNEMNSVNAEGGLARYEKQTGDFREQLLKATTLNEIDSIEAIIKHREEVALRYKEAAQEVMKLTGKMDSLDNVIESMNKAFEQIAKSSDDIRKGLADDKQRNKVADLLFNIKYDEKGYKRNTSPLAQFKAASEILDDYRKQRIDALQMADTYSFNAKYVKDKTNEERQADIEKSQEYLNKASNLAGIISQVEGFISSLNTTSSSKPDLTNVTSLGQYGFNMGEKNDNVYRMENYYKNVEDLTRQIRNKLQEGIKTEASYN